MPLAAPIPGRVCPSRPKSTPKEPADGPCTAEMDSLRLGGARAKLRFHKATFWGVADTPV